MFKSGSRPDPMFGDNMKERLNITIFGAVQGVGFRPFVYNLAKELGLSGWIRNTSCGVSIEIEGEKDKCKEFISRVDKEKPAHSFFQSFEMVYLDEKGYSDFEILESLQGEAFSVILPDIATCPECVKEIMDKKNRRHFYPFTNCTNCGPRYSIIKAVPYDRKNTTMDKFKMCKDCNEEYKNPTNRRTHRIQIHPIFHL